uniref:hypothetical protein n=1 Tax=Rheinheimera sp. TaxID=1869214 RepID=UPI0040487188
MRTSFFVFLGLILFAGTFFTFSTLKTENEDLPLEPKFIDENQARVVSLVKENSSFTSGQTQKINTNASHINSFDNAIQLHQKALKGDTSSQYELGHILSICFHVAEYREKITHNVDLLYAYHDSLPNDVLARIEQLTYQCSDFKPENFYLFNPVNDSDHNFLEVNENNFETGAMLGYYWLSEAANAGHLDALINILGLPLLPPMSVDIDKPELVEALDEQLMLANPDLLVSLSSCITEPISKIKTALIDSACSATKNCRELLRYDLLLLMQLERLYVDSNDEKAIIGTVVENNLTYVDFVKLIESWKDAESEYHEYQKTFISSLNDKAFRQSLIENCTRIMKNQI